MNTSLYNKINVCPRKGGIKINNQAQNKAVVFFGSPHEDSYTAKLMRYFLDNLNDFEENVINAYEERITPCIDCGWCARKPSCRFKDLNLVHLLLESCNLIAVASPVYNSSFPAPLKAIFDRMQRYYRAKFDLKIDPPFKKSKQAVVLLTQGSSKNNAEKVIQVQLNPILKLLGAADITYVSCLATDSESACLEKSYAAIKDIVNKLNGNL